MEIYAENVKQNLTIEIHKKDQNSKPLQGAVFEIRNAKTDALVATTDRTGTDGKVTVSVPAGDYEYTVTEIAAPEGYVPVSYTHLYRRTSDRRAASGITEG